MTVEELQDEICAIDAIYPDITKELAPQIYEFKIPQHEQLLVQFSFPERYPDEVPQIIQVFSKNLDKYTDTKYIESTFRETLDKIFNAGEVILFEFFMELEQILEVYNEKEAAEREKEMEREREKEKEKEERSQSNEYLALELENLRISTTPEAVPEVNPFEGWSQSEVIEDRASKFIGYARTVHSVEEAEKYLNQLLTDRRISRASHNMTTWRIKKDTGVQYQDCDDDGETAAGGRMLHLLQVCIIR